jgi:hypothetical membrane protein
LLRANSIQRLTGIAAACVPFWFLAVYLVMSGARPEYSHLTKAVSELGSLDAPHRWAWNLLGYMLPGLVVAALGLAIGRDFARDYRTVRVPAVALTASGLFMLLSGIFPGDFEHRQSPTMILHAIGSLGSYAAFLVAGFWLPVYFQRRPAWRSIVWPTLALVLGSIASGVLRSGSAPGLGQRIGFACFFAWIGIVGFTLMRRQRGSVHG